MIKAQFKDGQLTFDAQEPGVYRKRRWKVDVSYDTPAGAQQLTVEPDRRCRFDQIAAEIDQALSREAGPVSNLQWRATGR